MTVDAPVERHLDTRKVAEYLGCRGRRHVQLLIERGALVAIDIRAPEAKRSRWSVPWSSVREFIR